MEVVRHDVGVEETPMENLLNRPNGQAPDPDEILRRLRDQLLEAHRRKIFQRADDEPPAATH